MKNFLFLLVIMLAFTVAVSAQEAPKPAATFDADAAKRTGADDYGMKAYVFAFLRVGKAKRPDAKTMEPLQAGHLKTINKLADEGRIVLAGPFTDGGEMRGIFIFNVKTVEEAKELVKADPLISAGYLDVEFHTWYGSAALVDVTMMHKKLQKKSMF